MIFDRELIYASLFMWLLITTDFLSECLLSESDIRLHLFFSSTYYAHFPKHLMYNGDYFWVNELQIVFDSEVYILNDSITSYACKWTRRKSVYYRESVEVIAYNFNMKSHNLLVGVDKQNWQCILFALKWWWVLCATVI